MTSAVTVTTFTIADAQARGWGSRSFPVAVIIGWLVVHGYIVERDRHEYEVTALGLAVSAALTDAGATWLGTCDPS